LTTQLRFDQQYTQLVYWSSQTWDEWIRRFDD
jgi:hypothetical protein